MTEISAKKANNDLQCRIENLPKDILIDILVRLPLKNILSSKSVSKSWLLLTSSSEFATLHNSRLKLLKDDDNNYGFLAFTRIDPDGHCDSLYHMDFDDSLESPALKISLPSYLEGFRFKKIMDTCNGLLFCYFMNLPFYFKLVLLNPSTGTYQEIPIVNFIYESSSSSSSSSNKNTVFIVDSVNSFGFGYDPVTDDYKIVSIVQARNLKSNTKDNVKVSMYSTKFGLWSIIDDLHDLVYNKLYHEFQMHAIVVDNHLLNWVMCADKEDDDTYKILSFDLCNDEWSEVLLPKLDYPCNIVWLIGELRGCLCLATSTTKQDHHQELKMWVMKKYGVRESWEPLFDITLTKNTTAIHGFGMSFAWYPIIPLKEGISKVLLEDIESEQRFWYDPRTKSVQKIRIRGSEGCNLLIKGMVHANRTLAILPRRN